MEWFIAIFLKRQSKHLCFGHHNLFYLFIFGAMGLLIGLLPKNYETSPSQVEITFFPLF
jgi:hypothetical protein